MAIGFPAKTNFATGDVLTATNMNDVTGTLNLLQSTLYPAGRNKIINGDFSVNQRAFTSTVSAHGFDRWAIATSGATATYSAQTFTLGTAPVAGYEGKNFARLATTVGNDLCRLEQKIESVRTFAGETVIVSFWAKGTNPATAGNLAITLNQFFGTGGSPSSQNLLTQQTYVLTANWTRYSFTFAVPSIAGKTLGTNNDDHLALWIGQGTSVSADAWTLDLWGVQVEAASTGSTASPFQTASGSIAGELALCQRYYYRISPAASGRNFGLGQAFLSTNAIGIIPYPVTMRISPTALEQSGTAADYAVTDSSMTARACTSVPAHAADTTNSAATISIVATNMVAGDATFFKTNASTAFLGWSAEL